LGNDARPTEVLLETAVSGDPDDFNEETVRQMFFNVPSGARH
jgi:hypothetical protein